MTLIRECPRCHAIYKAGEDFCGADGARLIDKPAAPSWVRPEELLGQALGGRFVLKEVLGGTESAVVYRATHRMLEKDFAVKLMRRASLRNEKAVARFLREARVASTVDHPHVVNIYDFGLSDQGEPYLVIELVDGSSLREVIDRSPGGRLPIGQAVDIAIQVAQALAHIHARGVVHRNLKPENIVLTHRDGHADFVKILDLGVARRTGQTNLTQNGEIIGTPEFIAPEAWSWSDAAPPHPSMDLYAFGILLHIMVSGRPPFLGERGEVMMDHLNTVPPRLSAQARSAEIPQDLDLLAAQLLLKDPAQRPDAEAALARLQEIQAQLPPPSLRSLLLQKTLILSPHERDTYRKGAAPPQATVLLSSQATVVLDRQEQRGTGAVSGPAPPGKASEPAAPAATAERAVLAQVDALEAEIERTRRRLCEYVEAYGERIWGRAWPNDAEALRAAIRAHEGQEEAIGIQLAMQAEQLQQVREEKQARRSALRRRILDLSQRISGLPTEPSGQLQLRPRPEGGAGDPLSMAAELAAVEQEYSDVDMEDEAPLLAAMALEQERLQEARNGAQAAWMQLARRALQAAPPPQMGAERRKLEQLTEQVESLGAAMVKLLQTYRPG
jgi:serine/threonine protein kinase